MRCSRPARVADVPGRQPSRAVAAVLLCCSLLPGGGPPVSTAAPIQVVRSATLPPGQSLPDDGECARRVRPPESEIRPQNAVFNQTMGRRKSLAEPLLKRVSGEFTGTTDQIMQWASCKWGIDTDVVRAQAAQESSWFMTSIGDFTDDQRWCVPGRSPGGDGRPGCPESVGIMGVKYRYHAAAFPEAEQSTAYNLDYTLAVWRNCFEGEEHWLSDHPPHSGYRPGDLWGCIGRWYSGDWLSAAAAGYINRVQAATDEKVWASQWFGVLSTPASAG